MPTIKKDKLQLEFFKIDAQVSQLHDPIGASNDLLYHIIYHSKDERQTEKARLARAALAELKSANSALFHKTLEVESSYYETENANGRCTLISPLPTFIEADEKSNELLQNMLFACGYYEVGEQNLDKLSASDALSYLIDIAAEMGIRIKYLSDSTYPAVWSPLLDCLAAINDKFSHYSSLIHSISNN